MARPSPVRELPEIVKNQIAAGEVVERPASVVKELVENALDAGATRIQVDLEEGGVRLVRITDNGSGMRAGDLDLAFRPHATSKLHELEDLDHIASLGFRGEALASIGSVARCRILTRAEDDSLGSEIVNEGGKLGSVQEAGAPLGTTLEVRDLFYNTPARRRFLKRTQTELGRCLDVLQRLALGQLGVGFVVNHNGARVLDVEPEMDLRGRVRRIYSSELADSLEPVSAGDDNAPLRLRGLVAPPRFSLRQATRLHWLLNGRPLRDRVLVSLVKQGYRGYLEDGRLPSVFLHLSMDPALVDVNVHPTKSEVRFRDDKPLFSLCVPAIRSAVARTDIATPGEKLLARVERRGDWVPRTESFLPDPGGLANARTPRVGDERLEVVDIPRAESQSGASAPEGPGGLGFDSSGGRVAEGPAAWARADEFEGPFIQIDKTYLVRALPDGFEVVDQHALHERMTFEGLREDLHKGSIAVQRLLMPEVCELARDEVSQIEANLEGLARLGIELSIFGPTSVAVQGLPARLRRPDAEGIVRDVLATLSSTGQLPDAEEVLEELLHRTACRSSIMAGDELDQSSIRSLLERADQLENSQTCPHSRPTRVRFTLADLEKAFHRT